MRYFLEVAYKGTNYAGFQLQANANTIQAEVEKAIYTCCRKYYKLTGSSRTDSGVHAYQNYFHIDVDSELPQQLKYNLNSVLPTDIAIKNIVRVSEDAHCRFHANARKYKYYITRERDPFLIDTAWYYPYKVDLGLLQEAARIILNHTDFTSFSKLHTHTNTNECKIFESSWSIEADNLIYQVRANRFLRGMVKSIVSTSLHVGRGLITMGEFENIVRAKDCSKASFSTPAKGLFLVMVEYPSTILSK
jgi:tRNA pseudouridine38-40 synthase